MADARTGERLPGIYTPLLASTEPEPGQVGLEAYFVPSEGLNGLPSGVWYLHVPGKYESPTGEYRMVGFVEEQDDIRF